MAELCVALDVSTQAEALGLADELRRDVVWFKVGLELFTAAGPQVVRALHTRGAKVFLDLKLHDIPETVARATAAAGALGAELLTLHAVAGEAAVRAAVAVKARPKLIAVTVLTSDADPTAATLVLERGRNALHWGVDGLVASPAEAATLRNVLGKNFLLITPGIRLAGVGADDHARSATPQMAVRAGADLLVVGRPIRDAADPLAAASAILADINS